MHKVEKNKYRIKVNEHFYLFEQKIITGKEVLKKSGNIPVECFTLYQKFKKCDFEKIDLNEEVDLSKKGIERFVVKEAEVFHYFVDDEPETTDQKELTPKQILELAGITPVEDYYIIQIFADGNQESYQNSSDTIIKMTCPAMKFISVFNGETPVAGN
jgi:multiubiquitin